MKSDKQVPFTLEFAEEAYDDLVNIQNYTYSSFGETQWKKYASLLDEAFQFLLKHPFGGNNREDIPPEYRTWVVAEHLIIYRIEETTIYIARVLHSRMNFRYQF